MFNLETIQQRVIDAGLSKAGQLEIIGGINSSMKANNQLAMSQYSGVIEYHPEELVISVKAGTKIEALNEILADNNQVTSFKVAQSISTIGGAYATGCPDLRDAVLGVKIIDGQGRLLSFGGQVMKNVAGYDIARLLVGSKGKLAVICEISFKVIPKPYANLITNNNVINSNVIDSNVIDKITDKNRTQNELQNKPNVKEKINSGLKNIFDPNGVFI